MKYIRTDFIGVVMFSETRGHKEMADRLLSPNDSLISAGFVNQDDYIDDGQVTVHGHSTSLGIGVADDDEDWIRILLKR